MDKKNNYSTLISIGLHILLFISLIIFTKPVSILMPSRSDGITVALVGSVAPTPTTTNSQMVNNTADALKTLDAPADVNLEDKKEQKHEKSDTPPIKPQEQTKPAPTKSPEKIEAKPQPTPPPEPAKPTAKPNNVKSNIKADINDLLGDVTSTSTSGIRKGKALGGHAGGTSDSDNLVGSYADDVINAVRPYVSIPENINPKAKAIVKVELYPNLNVKSITLIKSSGNSQYDDSVQTAIKKLKTFPQLPSGAQFVNYRILNLSFVPY